MNFNEMAITDEIADEMNKHAQLKEANAGQKFKNIVYPNIDLPGKVAMEIVDNVGELSTTLDNYQKSMIAAIAKNNHDSTANSDENEDATNKTVANGDPTDTDANDIKNPDSEGNDVKEHTPNSHNKKPEM